MAKLSRPVPGRSRPRSPIELRLSFRVIAGRWWESHATICFLLLGACSAALLYARVIAAPFVYDDVDAIQRNPALASWHDLTHYFHLAVPLNNEYRGYAGSIYRPLVWLGFIVERKLWGLSPTHFHIVNVILHWANCSLGYALLLKLRVPRLPAMAACLIWMALPINAEAIAWISGRHTCQATLFILLSLLAAASYLRCRRVWALIGYIGSLVGALLSNEWAILAIPLTVLIAYVEYRIQCDSRTHIPAWAALSAASLTILCLYGALRRIAGASLPLGPPHILPLGASFVKYFAWIILPIQMSVERSSDTPGNKFSLVSATALIAILLFFALIFRLHSTFPRIMGGLAWMSISLAPFCGVVFLYQGMAERYVYLATGGFAFALVAAVIRLEGRIRTMVAAVITVWVAWGVWRLEARLLDWKDEETLYAASLRATPDSAVLLYNLGGFAASRGDTAKAAAWYQRAVDVNPDYVSALINLANIRLREGHDSEALALLRKASSLAPQDPDVWVNLGNAYLQSNSPVKAEGAYERSLQLRPGNVTALIDLGVALQEIVGKSDRAEQAFRRAIEVDPKQGPAYCDLAALLLKKGDGMAALQVLQNAIANSPSYAPAYYNLGVLYQHNGQKDLAIEMYERAVQIDPDDHRAALALIRLRAENRH